MSKNYWNGEVVYLANEVAERLGVSMSKLSAYFGGDKYNDVIVEGVTHYRLNRPEITTFSKENNIQKDLSTRTYLVIYTERGIEVFSELTKGNETPKNLELFEETFSLERLMNKFQNEVSHELQKKDIKINTLNNENNKLKQEIEELKQQNLSLSNEIKEVEEKTIDQVMIGMGRLITEQINSIGKTEGFKFKMDKNGNLERLNQ